MSHASPAGVGSPRLHSPDRLVAAGHRGLALLNLETHELFFGHVVDLHEQWQIRLHEGEMVRVCLLLAACFVLNAAMFHIATWTLRAQYSHYVACFMVLQTQYRSMLRI